MSARAAMSARSSWRGWLSACCAAAALLAGAARAASDPAPYAVAPGDVLEIAILAGGERQEEATATVAPDGSVVCPLVGVLHVAGLNVPQITDRLQTLLARDYFQDPRVVVSVRQFGGTVLVSGEVKHPGVYPLVDARTALGACAVAGGFTEYAAARSARVLRVRDGRTVTLRVDLAKLRKGRGEDVVLEAGDRVEVPRRAF